MGFGAFMERLLPEDLSIWCRHRRERKARSAFVDALPQDRLASLAADPSTDPLTRLEIADRLSRLGTTGIVTLLLLTRGSLEAAAAGIDGICCAVDYGFVHALEYLRAAAANSDPSVRIRLIESLVFLKKSPKAVYAVTVRYEIAMFILTLLDEMKTDPDAIVRTRAAEAGVKATEFRFLSPNRLYLDARCRELEAQLGRAQYPILAAKPPEKGKDEPWQA